MSDFPDASGSTHVSPEMASMLGDLQKKNSLATVSSPGGGVVSAGGAGSGIKSAVLFGNGLSSSSRQNVSSSIKETSSSSSSQQVSTSNKYRTRTASVNHETIRGDRRSWEMCHECVFCLGAIQSAGKVSIN